MDKVNCHSQDLDSKLKEIDSWNISKEDKKGIKDFFRDYELGKITGRRGSNPQGSLLRFLYFLKVALENLEGSSEKQVEDFLEKLLKDKFKTYNSKTKEYSGNSYALKSKKEILKTLERYLSWKNPSKKAVYKSVLDIKFSIKKNDFETLKEDDLKKLVEGTDNPDKKFFLAVIGSGGLRAEEFHNLRYSDFELPKGKDMFVKVRIKNQFSKTKGRTISLYDKFVLPIVSKYLSLKTEQGIKPEEVLFKTTYYGNRNWLQDYSKKILGKNVNYHLFRHTSATRLSSKLNRQQLCIYFGWSFSSPMADLYIERAGVNMEDVESKFEKIEFEKQQEELNLLKEDFDNREKEYAGMFAHLKKEVESLKIKQLTH